SRNADGTLQTNSLSMGKFTVSVDTTGHAVATRDFGYGATVYMPASGQMMDAVPEKRRLGSFVRRLHRIRKAQGGTAPAVTAQPAELEHAVTQAQENFTFLGSPARWFEPDSGLPVTYMIDSTGDSKLGFAASRAAIDAAFAAWTNVSTSN